MVVSVCATAVQPQFVKGEILVKYKSNVPASVRDTVNKQHGAKVLASIAALGVVRITAPRGGESAQCKSYKANTNVEYAEPNYIAKPSDTIPTDTYFSSQWDLVKIQAPAAWDVTTGSSALTIAVIDTGVDYNHPDLSGHMVAGYDFFSNDTNPMDEYGHGTKCAGVVGALSNNASGIAGITWNCMIMPLKVSDAMGASPYSCIGDAIIYAADHGARVATISLGASIPSTTLQDAVNYAYNKGCVIIAASGNESASAVCYPAACNNVIAVGATDANDLRCSYSNYGSALDVSAPGYAYTTTKGGGYAGFNGSSAAAPHVAAVAALAISRNLGMSAVDVANLLKNTADDIDAAGWDQYTGSGRINAFEAVSTMYVPAPDTIAPTVSILSPVPGATSSATVSVNVAASDNVAICKVELYCDNMLVGQSSGAGSILWNTVSSIAGPHVLSVFAYDAVGNVGKGSPVTVTVDNSFSVTQTYTGTTNAKSKTFSFTLSKQANINATLTWSGSAAMQLLIYDSKGSQLANVSSAGNPINLSLGCYPAGIYKFTVGSKVTKINYTLTVKGQAN
jgi:subtilisin family serine protease